MLTPQPKIMISAFRITVENDGHSFPDDIMESRCADSFPTAREGDREDSFIPESAVHPELPEANRRFRVIGHRDAAGLLMLGSTDAHRSSHDLLVCGMAP
jgi:hypothetical protein